jgi:hypothetical protein
VHALRYCKAFCDGLGQLHVVACPKNSSTGVLAKHQSMNDGDNNARTQTHTQCKHQPCLQTCVHAHAYYCPQVSWSACAIMHSLVIILVCMHVCRRAQECMCTPMCVCVCNRVSVCVCIHGLILHCVPTCADEGEEQHAGTTHRTVEQAFHLMLTVQTHTTGIGMAMQPVSAFQRHNSALLCCYRRLF